MKTYSAYYHYISPYGGLRNEFFDIDANSEQEVWDWITEHLRKDSYIDSIKLIKG